MRPAGRLAREPVRVEDREHLGRGGGLGLPAPGYAHVPLVLGPDGARLAKRHGAVTLDELGAEAAVRWMAGTLGMPEAATATEMLAVFDPDRLPREPTRWSHGTGR